MILKLYQMIWVLLPFLIKRYLKTKAIKTPAYLAHWDERFGKPYPNPVKNCIWIHAVSVGETQAAEPIVKLLSQYYPDLPLLITQMTPTGRKTAVTLFPTAQCRYLAYDKLSYVKQFIEEHQPMMALFLETEIWPNYCHQLDKKQIPSFLLNARLSLKSLNGYRKIARLITPAINCFTMIFAQTETDKQHFQQLGAKRIEVSGNSKYDIVIKPTSLQLSQQIKATITSPRKIVVCGSTRVKDNINEAFLLLDEWQKHQNQALLIIVPRHPELFEAVYQYSLAKGFKSQRRSANKPLEADTQVLIVDSMGELMAFYLLADIAFVGGSLVDVGCHNIIEPIMGEVPTLFGFSTFNFNKVCQDALQAQCAIQVNDATQWYQVVNELLHNDTQYLFIKSNASTFISQHQGASLKMVQEINKIISSKAETT